VNEEGFIDIEQLKKEINENTLLVSIIHGNNEIGTIQNLKEIGQITKEKNVLLHTDACQSFTKIPINVKEENIDLMTINSHKIHGPKGAGALYIRKGIDITPLFHGGGHEFKKRAGTENITGIVGFGKAVEIGIKYMNNNIEYISNLRDYMIEKLLEIPYTKLNGSKGKDRLVNNVNITFLFIEGEAMLLHLDIFGVCVSTGSACSSKSLKPSHVLTALGRSPEEAHGSIRFTLSKYTTKEEMDITIEKVKQVVENLRRLSPLTPTRTFTSRL
jgi:cysteine desulfurase